MISLARGSLESTLFSLLASFASLTLREVVVVVAEVTVARTFDGTLLLTVVVVEVVRTDTAVRPDEASETEDAAVLTIVVEFEEEHEVDVTVETLALEEETVVLAILVATFALLVCGFS